MRQTLLNQLDYFVWQNFVDWRVWLAWVRAMAAILVLASAAWGFGSVATGPRSWRSRNEALFVTLPTGLAVFTALLFAAALVGGYRLPVAALIAAAGVAAPLLAAPRTAGAWRARTLLDGPVAIARAVREMPGLWTALLFFSVQSLCPPVAWDEVMYHLAYPQQWVAAGRLTVDPYAWYPLSSYNWQLLEGVGLMLSDPSVAHLLGWLAGALTTVGVRVFLLRLGVDPRLALIGALAVALTPTVALYFDSGHVDTALMCYSLVVAYAFMLLAPEEGDGRQPAVGDRRWLPAALCGGMLLGIKITSITYIPLVLGLALFRLRRGEVLRFAAVFALVGGLWYAYNLARGGDPAPPLFSNLLGRETLYWNAEDRVWPTTDLRRGRITTLAELAALPVQLVRRPPPPIAPRYDGPLLGYVLLFPFTLLAARELWRRRLPEPLVAAWYGAAVWFATSTLLVRYASFIPLAVVCSALLLDRALRRLALPTGPLARRALVPALGAFLLLGPTPYAFWGLRNYFRWRVPTTAEARHRFLREQTPNLLALDALERVGPPPADVYLTQNGLRYHYQSAGYRMIGNVMHPGRFPDFRRAVQADTAGRFLRGFGVDYLVVDKPLVGYYVELGPAEIARALARDPELRLLHDDSISAIYKVVTAASTRGTNDRPPGL